MAEHNPEEGLPAPRMLTVNEVAHLLHVHPNTVRLWGKNGTLKAYRIGKRRDYRFSIEDIKAFLDRNIAGDRGTK